MAGRTLRMRTTSRVRHLLQPTLIGRPLRVTAHVPCSPLEMVPSLIPVYSSMFKIILAWTGGVAQVAKRLPNKCEAVSSNPSTVKKGLFLIIRQLRLDLTAYMSNNCGNQLKSGLFCQRN
jgi:hypothetical protein